MNYKLLLGGLLVITSVGLWLSANQTDTGLDNPAFMARSSIEFQQFRSTYNKSYTTIEDLTYRFKIFRYNLKMIEEHNAKGESYTMGINQFGDLTYEEFADKYLSTMKDDPESKCDKMSNDDYTNVQDADNVDWVALGKVQDVKNQEQCGSCWAFSAVGALESAYAIYKNVELPNLSEQELVDCSLTYGNNGCGGGLMNLAFDYILDNKLNTEEDYPYTARNQNCKGDKKGQGSYSLKSCVKVEPNTQGLTKALTLQPVSVALHAGFSLMFYSGGVYDPWLCSGQANHAVLAVGFDLTAKKPFYKVKNSWGSGWGEKGYFKIAVGKKPEGVCKIAGNGYNYYPVV